MLDVDGLTMIMSEMGGNSRTMDHDAASAYSTHRNKVTNVPEKIMELQLKCASIQLLVAATMPISYIDTLIFEQNSLGKLLQRNGPQGLLTLSASPYISCT